MRKMPDYLRTAKEAAEEARANYAAKPSVATLEARTEAVNAYYAALAQAKQEA